VSHAASVEADGFRHHGQHPHSARTTLVHRGGTMETP